MAGPILEIRHLGKAFQSKNAPVCALDDVNLTVEQGEIFGIIGMSGAGKSTLVRCINMLERPTSGSVIFDGKDMCTLPDRELRQARRSIGMIFQQFNLLMQRTALENVCFPLELAGVKRDEARQKAQSFLELVGLADRVASYPSQLSGGQKQRVAIARALVSDPKVLLCDEATSALDPNTTESILALIKDINRRLGITVIIITHEMKVITRICDRVAIIGHGHIVESGTVADVFLRPRTEEARRLVMPDGEVNGEMHPDRLYRLVFNGTSSFAPVVSSLVLETHMPVNIMFADTRDINGCAFGQIVLQLPSDEKTRRKMIEYARAQGVEVEEITNV